MSKPRSFSQWSQYRRCPYSFYLGRIEKVPRIPAAWSPQGTAIHEALERWELSNRTLRREQVIGIGLDVYDREIRQLEEVTPNLRHWFASGPYGADEDIPRRRLMISEHVDRALLWYAHHPEQKPWRTLNGLPGVEVPFQITLNGIEVRGYIDWIGSLGRNNDPVLDRRTFGPRDIKTGRKPGHVMQLKIYSLALQDHLEFNEVSGFDPLISGDFFMTRTGKPTVLQDLGQITRDEVGQEFEALEDSIGKGDFPPKPSEGVCRFCDVKHSCNYRVG